MTLSKQQVRIAGELGKRLAAADEAAVEDIQAVIAPIIRGAYERFGEEVILQISSA
jgi:hypothetical protein